MLCPPPPPPLLKHYPPFCFSSRSRNACRCCAAVPVLPVLPPPAGVDDPTLVPDPWKVVPDPWKVVPLRPLGAAMEELRGVAALPRPANGARNHEQLARRLT